MGHRTRDQCAAAVVVTLSAENQRNHPIMASMAVNACRRGGHVATPVAVVAGLANMLVVRERAVVATGARRDAVEDAEFVSPGSSRSGLRGVDEGEGRGTEKGSAETYDQKCCPGPAEPRDSQSLHS